MPGVLIISRDWQSRALLRAQLIEDGVDVRAYTSAAEAGAWVPALVLADLSLTTALTLDRGDLEAI